MRGDRAWAEIDLSAIRHNLRYVARRVGPGVAILAVVKADAYGHGAVPVAYTALRSGCRMLGVGDSSEALELLGRGITAPILILGAIVEEEIPRVVENRIQVTVHSTTLLDALEQEARRQGRLLDVHVKIDTGMRRLGVSPAGVEGIVRRLRALPHLRLAGICTHLSTISTGDPEYARLQLEEFRRVVSRLRHAGLLPAGRKILLHLANSAALLTLTGSHFDMVRAGIAMYGSLPASLARFAKALRPALSFKTRVAFLKSVPAGAFVGYDQRYRCPRATRLATCPVGYSDGYPYSLTNRGIVLVRGRRAPVVGSVTMDYIVIDVGGVPGVRIGDEVTLIGRDRGAEISMSEVARRAGTIPYEISCRLGRRVRRIYVDSEESATSDKRIARWRKPNRLAG